LLLLDMINLDNDEFGKRKTKKGVLSANEGSFTLRTPLSSIFKNCLR
jgi:hypothetical protein